ncbi:hypothetical protein J3R73_005870 [Labrys monachus]|uniref:Uncharacterized protein n=1 Tax=Labrys monachus TaxID=217067 RepID=A0ABU0FPU4_9HYPH|nr:hypothetical protein [Labrys monachus]
MVILLAWMPGKHAIADIIRAEARNSQPGAHSRRAFP